MNDADLDEQVRELIAQDVFKSLPPKAKEFAATYPMAFHDQVDSFLSTAEGQALAARMRADLAESQPASADTGNHAYGPNGAQLAILLIGCGLSTEMDGCGL